MKLKRLKIDRQAVEYVADLLEHAAYDFITIDYSPKDFYVGIGKDMSERAQWHNTDYLIYVETESRAFAGAVESEMSKRGFNTGSRPDNGGTPESVCVYIYLTNPYTRETE